MAGSSVQPAAHSMLWKLAFAVLGVVAFLAWFLAGYVVLIGLLLMPDPGAEMVTLLLKGALGVAWVATLLWLWREFLRGRFRFVVVPVVSWVALYAIFLVLGWNASLNFGY